MAERQQHECSVCQTVAEWGPSWRWYGSYNDVDGGSPFNRKHPPRPIVKMCGDICKARAEDLGMVPRNAPEIDQ